MSNKDLMKVFIPRELKKLWDIKQKYEKGEYNERNTKKRRVRKGSKSEQGKRRTQSPDGQGDTAQEKG